MRTLRNISLVILFLFLSACVQNNDISRKPPEAVAGVLDLQDWDFEKDGSIDLAGEWAFYWEELIPPDQIKNSKQTSFVSVPGVWTNYDIEGVSTSVEGYATFSLTVYPPKTLQTYGLYIEGQGTTYMVWIDGRLIAQNGEVGTDRDSMTPEKKPVTVFFQPDGEMMEIVVQISNFHHRKGGFRNSLSLGLSDTIYQNQLQSWFFEAFSVGTLFVMGLYHLFIYLSRKKELAPLYFALLTWVTTVRIGVTNQSTLLFHMPMLSWPLALRIEYLTFFIAPIFFSLFMRSLYPKDIHRWFIRGVISLGIGFTLFMVFTDTLTLSYTSTYYQFVYFLELIYYLFFLVRIITKKREGAAYIAFATLVMIAAIIIEALSLQNILPYAQITAFGFLAYIFVQAILLSGHFSRSYARVESLSGELEDVNIDLQQSERKYRNLFEESKDMIFISGLDAQIEDVSPACVEVLGYTKDELCKMKIMDVSAHPEVRAEFEKTIANQGSVRNFETELLRKDGQKIDALVTATLRRDENGKVVGIQGSVRDITDRKKAAAEKMRALKLEQIAITDPLTNIYNRRFFHEVAEKEFERSKRSGSPLSIILLDIDNFKDINDSYGHLAGDQILISFAKLCQGNIRTMDVFARFGGDEFVIMMPDIDASSAQESAERLRKLVAEKPLATSKNIEISATVSVGIANFDIKTSLEIDALLDKADKALYQSKEAGRNQVTVWEKEKAK